MTAYQEVPGVSRADDRDASVAETTVSRLAQRLRADILSGRILPGARLKLRELSERFAVSQMPIRDVLVKLAAEGILDLQPNKGASVRRIDRQFIENMFDIRMALEEMLVGRCVERASDAEIATLRPLAEAHALAVEAGEQAAILASNSLFHRRISELARNSDAERILDQGWELIHAFRQQGGYLEGRLGRIVEEHRAILAAIERRDGAQASRLARQHVERSRDDLLGRFEF